ncbi:indole-3-glycerol phosphate synthase TrpC [filamentous cyanobacterium LEGE 11480]|uniref:Indole-3-glycerol phosphate synthase n=1 Tax=Romeriopsis navalis LEGE 11480 TaxID=2777977 RepID=A0A928Z702_9CYAN|nr:indole-3-glycerol phosphate synthase TrpC [Romeriopsis navalis]MBE9033198.1 indole-3-glycerol phosphate synthase TrpC [Romeriopsis navalis LEGE 11480]
MQIRRRPPNPAVNVAYMLYQIAAPDADPQNILEEIVWQKEKEVDQFREKLPLHEVQRQLLNAPARKDFLAALTAVAKPPAVIAEVKKASPSKGVIRADFDPVAIAQSYQQGGAACLSVLTDKKFFQGGFENLKLIRAAVDLPLLCKDFIIYPYQIQWAKLHGADAVLLIAAILSDKDLQYFLKITKKLGMTALVEVHDQAEFDRVLALDGVELLGINNRDLTTFNVDLQTTCELLAARGTQLSERGITVVSESGIHQPEDLLKVAASGANAVLIGESFMKQPDPGIALKQMIQ